MTNIGGASVEDAGKSVVDGSDDNGIDAIFFNKNTKHLVIVQSKFIKDGNSEPPADEVRTFKDGIHDLFDGKLHKFNIKANERKEAIAAISQFGVKCDLVLIYTGKADLAKHSSAVISELMIGLNGTDVESSDSVFKFHRLCKDEIFERLAKKGRTGSVELTFHLKEWGKIDKPHQAYYGRIYGSKIGEWWEQYGDDLLQDNIRKMLGDTDVNNQIAETALENPESFWYFNNGITVLAESIEKSTENRDNRDFGYFSAKGASVVNGAQTVSVLGGLAKKGIDLSRLEVPVRVISLSGQVAELRKDITRTNNTQNTILSKDFIAQDPVQESLQKQMSLLDYEYQVKRNEYFVSGERCFDLDEAIESLVMLSRQSNFAATFRKELGRFYISDRSLYKSLFNPSTSGYRVINAITFKRNVYVAASQLTHELPDEMRYGRKSQVLTNGLVITGQLVYKMIDIGDIIDSQIHSWDAAVIKQQVDVVASKIYDYCEANYNGNYLRTLFQNAGKCGNLFKYAITSAK